MPSQQPLQLGNFTFYAFEVPEALPNLFGVQKLAVHDFPGNGQGTRTIQQLGSFPFPYIEWTGMFWDNDTPIQSAGGVSAVERASTINTMRIQGQSQNLVWGPFQYQVIVAEFEVIGKLKQCLEYRIKLVPFVDNTTTSNTPSQPVSPEQAVFDANTGVTNSATSSLGLLLPPVITAAASLITQNVTAAILASNNSVSQLTTTQQAALQAQIAAQQLLLNPYINGNNYGQSSSASVMSSALYTLSTTLNINQNVPIQTITVTNPNLPQLASQYYNDASLWPLIAAANNLQDMFPIGTFSLSIPPANTQSQLIPSS